MSTAIWWIRRDLRLSDNPALNAALAEADQVLPVFVLDPTLWESASVGPKRRSFLIGGLRELDSDLRRKGGRLVVRRGRPAEVLRAIMAETGSSAIFAEGDVSPYARERDAEVAERLPLQITHGLTVHPPAAVRKPDGTSYVVFTAFRRAWKALPEPRSGAVRTLESIPTPQGISTQPIPAGPHPTTPIPFPPGESEAQRRLRAFVEGVDPPVHRYASLKDRLDLEGTSGLSPYLRFGMLSARQAVSAALKAIEAAPDPSARKGAETWLSELIWREFYASILYHHPRARSESLRPGLNDIRWENDEEAYRAWREGRTGYPVVDAAMRQLAETGWMPNRARMITASFLVKDLLIDWRWGERWFMRHLVDGDPAANSGGWQWTAGTGTDAAPYFRVFNPALQGAKFDPQGDYVRRWLPALSAVPGPYLHQPWEMPDGVQQEVGCAIGGDYPAPIVDHAWARQRTIEAYRHARQRGKTRPRGDEASR